MIRYNNDVFAGFFLFTVNAVYVATVVFDEGYPSLMDVLHGKKILSRIRARYIMQLIFRYFLINMYDMNYCKYYMNNCKYYMNYC